MSETSKTIGSSDHRIIRSSKAQLRFEARKHRKAIDVSLIDISAATDLFFKTLNPPKDKVIASYYPVGSEFDALQVLEAAYAKGYTCALPTIQNDTRVLKFVTWSPQAQLQMSKHNIPEVIEDKNHTQTQPDIIIVPLLAFDQKGARLGQGGGYYDATLAHYHAANKNIIAVGMGYAEQAVLFALPREAHDERLDLVITPNQAHDFRT
ncbi:MAG: 5-formyltetrahydrofolate cyclo-ligase [Bdellovibrionales bacterium]